MDTVNIEISKELIAPIVEAKIKAAMVEALGSSEALVNEVVSRCLFQKVDSKGNVSNYSSENKHSWIDIVLRQTIQQAASETVQEWVKDHAKEIKESLRKQLEQRKTRDAMAKGMIDGLVSATQKNWSFGVHFSFESPETDYGSTIKGEASVPF